VTTELVTAAGAARARAQELQRRVHEVLQTASDVVAVAQRNLESYAKTDTSALEREIRGLRTALDSRAVIEQAKGIIMGATRCDAHRAFDMLVRQSQHENRKLHDVAADLVASQVLRRG
jgi:AmiR/NasT family two-component response regulator